MASTPKAPDPYKQAQAQNSQNAGAAFANSVTGNANTYGPQGSTVNSPGTWYTDPNTGMKMQQWNQTTTLSPDQQKLYDLENQVKTGMGGLANQQIGQATTKLGQNFSQEGLQPWQTYGAAPGLRNDESPTDRASIEKAMMDSYYRGVKPQQSAEDAQLAARGMSPGSKQYYNIENQRGDAAAEQTRQAYLGSGAESRQAQEAYNKTAQQGWNNQNLIADQGNQLRKDQFGMNSAERNQIVNEISALSGGGQATMPQSQSWSGGQVNPFDIAGAQNQQYNIQAQQAANTNSGIFGLAGAGLKMLPWSDRRAKTDIKPIGALLAGVPLYTFKYWLDDTTHVGVMADETKPIHPDAVHMDADGYDHVDYELLGRRHAA